MSEALELKAEILKLARILGRAPEELKYLDQISSSEIRALREQVTEVLFTAHGHTFGRLAAASKLLPLGVVATIGERAFGPVLSARMAALLEPARAVEMAARLPVPFLADVAVAIDPRRASDVIGRIPPGQIAAVTGELVRRGEHVTMGRIVGHLPDEAIVAALDVMDDLSLLQVSLVLEDRDRLDHLVELMSDARLEGIIEAAATAHMWPEALDLLSHVTERARFAALPSVHDEKVLKEIVEAAVRHDLWTDLLPLVALLPPEARRTVGSLAAKLDGHALGAILSAVGENDLWRNVMTMTEQMPDGELKRRLVELSAQRAID